MMAVWILFVYSIYLIILKVKALPFYHQKDYDVKGDRVEIVWYDSSLFKDIKLEYYWYTRTQKALNGTGYFLQNNGTSDIAVEMQLYKFMSNEYRYFPVRVGFNVCKEYDNNNFNVKDLLKNISNIHGCPIAKGFYYIYNLKPDFSLLPPFIPRGQYKASLKLYYNQKFAGEGNAYGSIVDKPMIFH